MTSPRKHKAEKASSKESDWNSSFRSLQINPVYLDKYLPHSGPQFSHLQNKRIGVDEP